MGRGRLAAALVISAILSAGCGEANGSPTAAGETPTVEPSIAPSDVPTDFPTQAQAPTDAPTVIEIPTQLPYHPSGGVLPPNALTRIGIGYPLNGMENEARADQLVIGTGTGIYAYSLPDFDLIWRRGLEISPSTLSVSPTGDRLAVSYGFQKPAMLYDGTSGSPLGGMTTWWNGFWSPDGRHLVIEPVPKYPDYDWLLSVHDTQSGGLLSDFAFPEASDRWEDSNPIVTWSPNSQYFAFCSDRFAEVRDPDGGLIYSQPVVSRQKYPNYCGMAFSPDGSYLLTVDHQKAVVSEAATGNPVFEPEGSVIFGKWGDGRIYLYEEEKIRVIETATWSEVHMFEGKELEAEESPTGQQLIIRGHDQSTVYDTGSWQESFDHSALPNRAGFLQWSPSGNWITTGSQNTTDFLNPKTGNWKVQLREHFNDQVWPEILENDTVLYDGKMQLILVNVATSDVYGYQLGFEVISLGWAADGSTLVWRDKISGNWWKWSAATNSVEQIPVDTVDQQGQLKVEKIGYGGSPGGEWTSPDGRWHLVATNEAGIKEGPFVGAAGIFSGKLDAFLDSSTTPFWFREYEGAGVSVVAWSQDGTRMAMGFGGTGGEYTDRVVVLNSLTIEELYSFDGHMNAVYSLIFSPDGKMLASASDDGTIVVWNTP